MMPALIALLIVTVTVIILIMGYLVAIQIKHKNNMELFHMEFAGRIKEKSYQAQGQVDEELRSKLKEFDELKAKVDKLATKVAFKL